MGITAETQSSPRTRREERSTFRLIEAGIATGMDAIEPPRAILSVDRIRLPLLPVHSRPGYRLSKASENLLYNIPSLMDDSSFPRQHSPGANDLRIAHRGKRS